MANEKRLIDANAFLEKLSRMIDYCKNDSKVDGLTALFQVGDAVMDCSTVDAVVLPCKIGDLVYFHHIEGVKEDGSPIEKVRTGQVYQICIEANNEIWIRVSFGIWYCCRRYTDFYFSRKEAEAALAKMDGDG